MRRIATALVFLLSFSQDGWSQSPFFQTYYLLKKNEPVQVNKIIQDHNGFVWSGTNRGLFKYDGASFRRFTKADSLRDDNVTALAESADGSIWIGHANGQIAVLENGIIRRFIAPEGDATEPISDIVFDRQGTMWFATLNDGLYYFKADRLFRLDEADGMPDIFIYDIEQDVEGRIWAGTDGGVVICTIGDDNKVTIETLTYANGLPDNIVKRITTDAGNRMLLATEDAGVITYDTRTRKVEPVIPGQWHYSGINDLVADASQIWLATAGSGLVTIERSNGRVTTYDDVPNLPSATSIMKDIEGNIWAGSRSALVRSLGNYVQYIDIEQPGEAGVLAVAADQSGRIWYSTDDGLYVRSLRADGSGVVEKKLRGTQYEKYKIISLYADMNGQIWCGFYGEGAIILDPSTGRIRDISKRLRNGNVLNVAGKANRVWLATLNGATRVTIDGSDLKVDNFSRQEGLSADYIYQVYVDSRDRVWFASDREGVVMMDGSGFHHFLEGFSSKAVYGFAEDGDGNIWANVQQEGLYRFDGSKFSRVTRDLNIHCLSSTLGGDLVAVHDLGVEVFYTKGSRVRTLGDEIGFGERAANLNATARDREGRIFIGNDRGVIIFSEMPASVSSAPIPFIEGIKAFGVDKPLQADLQLQYDENNINLRFLGFWYQNPDGVTFQYRLEGYDLDWITTGDHSVIYSSLPMGDYTFRLRASDSADFTGSGETAFHFVVNPPFWRTTAFYFVAAIVITFAGYSLIRWRERSLLEDKLMLEQKVKERTFEIRRKNEEIQSQAEEIKAINESLERRVKERTHELERKNKALEEYAFINAHNLRSPVASLLGLINLLCLVELDDEGQVLMGHMKTSAERLDNVVKTITESIERGDRYEGFEEKPDDGID